MERAERFRWYQALFLGLILTLGWGINVTAFGQAGPTGNLGGSVQDTTGAVVSGVKVTATSTETGLTRTVVADVEGRWQLAVLPVGQYKVLFEAAGFSNAVANVTIEAAVPRQLDVKMEVGQVNVEVVVSDTTPLLTPSTVTTFRQLNAEELTRVPTATRSFTHLLSAEAGVSADLPPVLTNGNGNISPSVNGTRTTSTSLSFNGIDATNITSNEGSLNNNISPSPESLSEVKLQTSLYDASTGRSGGGNFQLVTRGGSNELHGSLYHYLQNEKLNANDFFFNKDGIARPRARRNEGGFTIGGPVRKNKLFYFGNYQRTEASTAFVPTASSISVQPQALQLINGARTKENLFAAFSQLNPGITASIPNAAAISDVAVRLLNIKNPATGDFFIPAPRGNNVVGRDINTGSGADLSVGGNPYIRQRNVFPATFRQDQFTTRLDYRPSENNTLSGTFFFSNFPGFDPFPDPNSLVSPVTLKRSDRNRTLAISDIHSFSPSVINEVRFGLFFLNNTRVLDDPFLEITNESVGIPNPALAFDQGPGTRRLGHYIGRPGTLMERFSFGGTNDSFNRREQRTWSVANNLTLLKGAHSLRLGGEYKDHSFDSALPEEQATEFEKFDNFTMLLRGLAFEADTQFGVTEKQFRFRDTSLYLVDDFRLNSRLNLNLGARWEWFGWPEERNGLIGNFVPGAITDFSTPLAGFLVAGNVKPTGFKAIDDAVAATRKASNNHTLNGEDLNNIAPRFGFAWTPFSSGRLVIRGGYGIFYDRPSAAFINTIFSNYPFLREAEVTFPASAVPLTRAWSNQNPNQPFNQYLPNRVVRTGGANGTYQIRDNTGVAIGADGRPNPTDPATGQPFRGNIAETFEFRAVDQNLRTPYIQQWNVGFQYELSRDLMFEARYNGTRGVKLLQATSFTQGFDLNNPAAPDFLFERFNQAYVAAGAPNGPLNAGSTARQRGLGRAFGFQNPYILGVAPTCANGQINMPANAPVDLNLANRLSCSATNALQGGSVITFEGRTPFLGFDVPEAVLLGNSAFSNYHSAQFSLTRRFSKGLQFNLAYSLSKAMDNSSVEPGSTAGSGKPDLPNAGFTAQGDAFNTRANYAPSDFDRAHRFSASFVYELPTFGSNSKLAKGWQVSGFLQNQTGTPFSIFSAEVVAASAANYANTRLGSGGLYRLAFGRPSLCGTLGDLRQGGSDPTERYFNPGVLCSPLTTAGGYPNNLGFGNLGRNTLRAPSQQRFDVGLAKSTQVTEKVGLEFRWEIFNLLNTVNFAAPENVIGDSGTDFNKVTNTVGGPRVMQFGLKLKF